MDNNNTLKDRFIESVFKDIENMTPIRPSLSAQNDMLKLNCVIGDVYKHVPVQEMFDIVPVSLAMRISYTPTILSNIAFRYGDKAIDIVKKKKYASLKPFTKMYENGKMNYRQFTIAKCNEKVIEQLNSYIDEMLQTNNFFMSVYYYTVSNSLLKEGYEIDDDAKRDMIIYMYMSLYIIRYISKLEKGYDKKMQELYDDYIKNDERYRFILKKKSIASSSINGVNYNRYLFDCHDAFIKSCRHFGFPMPDNEQMNMCAKTLHVETDKIINDIMKRFNISEDEKSYDKCKLLWDDIKGDIQ